MTTLQVNRRRCCNPFPPVREDCIRGTWRVCPGCRATATERSPATTDTAHRKNTPMAAFVPVQGDTARCGGQQPGRHAWLEWRWKWWRRTPTTRGGRTTNGNVTYER